MLRPRVIPVLLIEGRRLVKTRRFTDARYVGDPVNAVRIFNNKEVDELILLDLRAAETGRPNFDLIREIASEAFMPVAYGGGVRSLDDMDRLFQLGVEKVSLGRAAVHQPELISTAAARFGSQSVLACVDYRRTLLAGLHTLIARGREKTSWDPVALARRCAELGAGEILLQNIDRDGTREGYDLKTLRAVTDAVDVPVVACGGAGSLPDLASALHEGRASAAAAGSLFVFHGKLQAVLISYPSPADLAAIVRPRT